MKLFKAGFSNLDKRSKFLYMSKNHFQILGNLTGECLGVLLVCL